MKGKFFIESTGQTKGCGWIGAKSLFRCDFPEAKLKCKKTCNLCDENENTKDTKSSAPVTSSPTTGKPTSKPTTMSPTSAPVTSAPVTSAPITMSPTSIPVTSAPVTSAPTTGKPTSAPVTMSPTSAPVTSAPVTSAPTSGKPTSRPVTPPPSKVSQSDISAASIGFDGNQNSAQPSGKGKGGPKKYKEDTTDEFVCYDEKDWKLILEDQVEQVESFADLTCSDLEGLVEEEDHEEWCNYHR